MARFQLIVLVALQILLVQSFPADDLTQNMDGPESQAMETDLASLLEDVERQNSAGMDNENLDAVIEEAPNTDNSNQEEEEEEETYDDKVKDDDDERRGKEYLQEENLDNSHMFEGDIYRDKSTTELLNVLQNPGAQRDAITNAVRLWPRARVPYVFGRVSSKVRSAFKAAIADYHRYSCIRIVPRSSEKDYVLVVSEGGCWSSLGRTGRGAQKLSLGYGCEHKGTAIHELMHALGFFHEQSRLDRDRYITIHWANIRPGVEYNFKKYAHGQADTLNEPYDYGSIMHYPRWAFTKNRKDTIVPKQAGVKIGQRKGFSRIDLRQLNKLYKCRGGVRPTKPPTKPPTVRCFDRRSGCPRWARAGYCKGRYANYMKKNCRKSCKICKSTGVPPKCYDKKTYCPRWTRAGYCKRYSRYMTKYCPKSCKKC